MPLYFTSLNHNWRRFICPLKLLPWAPAFDVLRKSKWRHNQPMFYCVVYLNSAGFKGPPNHLPAFLDGLTAIWCVSFRKLWEGTKETFELHQRSLHPVCSASLPEPIGNIFLYLSIISSEPGNCLKWKVLAGKAKLQQIGLFERQWHFKIDVLELPHASWKQREVKDQYFTEASQSRAHGVPWLTVLSFACSRVLALFTLQHFDLCGTSLFGFIFKFFLTVVWDRNFFPSHGFHFMFQQKLGSFSPQ